MWTALTESLLLNKLTEGELQAYRQAVQRPSDPDQVASVLNETALLVRGACAQKNQYLEAGDTMVPGTLIWAATDIAAFTIVRRAGGQILDHNGARKQGYEDAMAILKDVADGKRPVERPDNADTVNLYGGFGPSVSCWNPSHPFRQWDACNQRGLQ